MSCDKSWGRYDGGWRPSSDDSFHSPTVIPPSALDKPSIMKRHHRQRTRWGVTAHADGGMTVGLWKLSSLDGRWPLWYWTGTPEEREESGDRRRLGDTQAKKRWQGSAWGAVKKAAQNRVRQTAVAEAMCSTRSSRCVSLVSSRKEARWSIRFFSLFTVDDEGYVQQTNKQNWTLNSNEDKEHCVATLYIYEPKNVRETKQPECSWTVRSRIFFHFQDLQRLRMSKCEQGNIENYR